MKRFASVLVLVALSITRINAVAFPDLSESNGPDLFTMGIPSVFL